MYTLAVSQDGLDTKSVVARVDTLRTIQGMEKWFDRVRSLMKEKGVTQDDLKSVLGVSTRGAVGHYLNNRREPSLDQFQALAKYFAVNLQWLLTGESAVSTLNEARTDLIDEGLLSLMSKATPRSYKQLMRIAEAAAEGRLTEEDVDLLNQIADRIASKE